MLRLVPRRFWPAFGLICLAVILMACTPSINPSSIDPSIYSSAPTIAVTPLSNEGRDELCKWFAKTQILREIRIQAGTEFLSQFENLPQDSASVTESTYEDLMAAVDKFAAANENFVEGWNKIGSNPAAKIFWEKELSSAQMKIEGLKLMAEGIDTRDGDRYAEGASKLEDAAVVGREGESAMVKIANMCKGK